MDLQIPSQTCSVAFRAHLCCLESPVVSIFRGPLGKGETALIHRSRNGLGKYTCCQVLVVGLQRPFDTLAARTPCPVLSLLGKIRSLCAISCPSKAGAIQMLHVNWLWQKLQCKSSCQASFPAFSTLLRCSSHAWPKDSAQPSGKAGQGCKANPVLVKERPVLETAHTSPFALLAA